MSTRALRASVLFLWGLFVGCISVPKVAPSASADSGVVGSDAGTPQSTPTDASATDTAPPAVVITSPSADAGFPASSTTVTVEGTATDDLGIATVEVSSGPNVAVAAASDDFFRTWRVTLPLPVGASAIRARAIDIAGKAASAEIPVTRAAALVDVEAPALAISEPTDGVETTRQSVTVAGTASDDTGLALVETRVDGLSDFTTAETSDTFATWRAAVGLAPGQGNTVRVRATDVTGKTVEVTRRVTSTAVTDIAPPLLSVETPLEDASVSAETITVTGSASDEFGIAKVEVKVGSGAYVSATTTNSFATWSAVVSIAPGANTLRIRATDGSDMETVETVSITNTFTPSFDTPHDYELHLAAPRDRTVSLTLDRTALGEVIPESVRRTIVLLYLDPAPLMKNILDSIKNACGSGWQYRSFTPNCPSSWGAPEKNMFRLLTMTPDNVNVAGTSIESVESLANALSDWGIISDFPTILAGALGIGRYETISDTTYAVAALKDNIIKTHPAVNADAGTLPVTMQDGYTDMAELKTRYGPSGSHPGFLDPSAATYSKVLLDSFQMSVSGTSNLTWYDGVDLSKGKEYIAILPTPTSDVITFDFTNTLVISGLASNPTVNLTFTISEYRGYLSAYTASNRSTPPSATPPGPGEMWFVSPWTIEYILADSAYRQYKNRSGYVKNYTFLGLRIAVVTVGANDTPSPKLPVVSPIPAGWARFWTIGGLGDPPPAQFVWEMIAEISEIRLRDGDVPEGQGTVRFSLTNIPVGLTGDQIKAQLKPSLEAQKSVLSARLLGDYRKNNGAVDFYLKGTAGDLYLFFVHSTDPLPSATYTYTTPGFYSDAALTTKVSSTAAETSGDGVHEKLKLGAASQTVYVKDNEGSVFKLEVGAAQSDRVVVRVSRKL